MSNKTENLWNAFCCKLKSYILKRISDPSPADDILQEIFLKIHEKIDTLKDHTKISSWVYAITRNTIIDYYRKNRNKIQGMSVVPLDDFDEIPASDETAEQGPAEEIASGLKDIVSELPEKYAQALLLVEFQGLSQTSLAKKLGISLSAAKSRVQRAGRLLKDNLMRCCHFEFDLYGTIIDVHPITCCCCQQYS
jgi:RNA polymerase sigma-70 factor (ECF subfamily)